MVDIGMIRKDIDSVVDMFDWLPVESYELCNLSISGQRQSEKKIQTLMSYV